MHWAQMSTVEHIYLLIAVAATVVLLFQLILACFAGVEFHINDGSGVDTHHDAGLGTHFQLLTVRNLVGFFTILGWTGLAFYGHMSLVLSIVLSFLCGLGMMITMATIFFLLHKLQSEGTMDVKKAIGLTGEVYITIPEKRTGYGKVNVVIQNQKRELHAITDGGNIQSGTQVKITDVINNQLLVERS